MRSFFERQIRFWFVVVVNFCCLHFPFLWNHEYFFLQHQKLIFRLQFSGWNSNIEREGEKKQKNKQTLWWTFFWTLWISDDKKNSPLFFNCWKNFFLFFSGKFSHCYNITNDDYDSLENYILIFDFFFQKYKSYQSYWFDI